MKNIKITKQKQNIPLYKMYNERRGRYFTNGFSIMIQVQRNFILALIQILMNLLQLIFAHIMRTVEL